ncbi:hypothetical protein CYY_000444 [Polysphondylium violaceum]|uniref:CUE domain-containing protein n=1 Tax=Polysphondylium violaceum TaxID=133409 RepID=A0A8J4VBJ5_9MYCE|nr:hypothetical protein CYY_000444 [Polysphondylium violaceum]
MSFFFNKKQPEMFRISPYDKERKIEQVLTMFPLLSRDHFLYSTMDRCNWDLNSSLEFLQRRHDYLAQEQLNIERRITDARLKREEEERKRQREMNNLAKLRDIFGNKFTTSEYSRALYDYRQDVEGATNHLMAEAERREYREERDRQSRFEREERDRIARLEREERDRISRFEREERERQARLDEEDRIRRRREREAVERAERDKKRINDLLLELKYQPLENKVELAQTKLFQDVVKDFGRLMDSDLVHPQYSTLPIAQPAPMVLPQPIQKPFYQPPAVNNNGPYFSPQPAGVNPQTTCWVPQPISSSPPPQYNFGVATTNNNNNNGNVSFAHLDPFNANVPTPANPFTNNVKAITTTPNNTNNTTLSVPTQNNNNNVEHIETLIKPLKEMFPTLSDEVIRFVLVSNDSISSVVQNLLDISTKVSNNKTNNNQ